MNRLSLLLILVVIVLLQSPAQAQWKKVKRFIQPEVTIIHESDKKLVVYHEALNDSIVLTTSDNESSDIYSDTAQKRGGNPFVIWVTTANFWFNSQRPKKLWGKFFRSEFLTILRPPAQLGAGD